jgi:hypothetical protein
VIGRRRAWFHSTTTTSWTRGVSRGARKRSEPGAPGIGFLFIPFVFPVLGAVIAVLYPLAGAAALGLAIALLVVGSSLGIPSEAIGRGMLLPALVLI